VSQLELVGVAKRYEGKAVLSDLSLRFPEDALTAVVGASGCGKSTLLKLCNGLVRPDKGVVKAFGQSLDYTQLPALRKRMGYAVQGTGLFPHLSAGENITLAARVANWSDAQLATRLDELLELMHLERSLLSRYPHELSGGQQQRVGLSRAMMLRPEILLLDEPFAAIDPITRFDIHRQLQELLAVEPVTVVLVTHDMREAMQLAQQIVVMDAGRICLDESTDTLRTQRPDLEPEVLLQSLMQESRA
jgi:osmoprotectant transport system ATP-binding protein